MEYLLDCVLDLFGIDFIFLVGILLFGILLGWDVSLMALTTSFVIATVAMLPIANPPNPKRLSALKLTVLLWIRILIKKYLIKFIR